MQPQGMFADPFAPQPQHQPSGQASAVPTDGMAPFPVATPASAAPFHDPTAPAASAPSFGGSSTNAVDTAPASPKSPSSAAGNGGSLMGSGNGTGNGSSAATTTADATDPPFPLRLQTALARQLQNYLDQSVPHHVPRWVGLAVLTLLYCVRVYLIEGFYIVTYGLGIFLLNLLIGFLTPLEDGDGDPLLPTNSREAGEFRPFIRRLPEFKFWWSCTKAVALALLLTFFQVFNVPVFWPILLVYFIVLFVLTMKRQIMHMWQHKYIPFSFGKPSYGAKGVSSAPPKRGN